MYRFTILAAAALMFVCVVTAQQPTPTPPAVCNFTTTKPKAEVKTYNFNNCILAKFASFISIDQGKFVELKNGVVDTNHSRCDSQNVTTVNPMLVIKFDCGELEFEISRSNDSKIFVKAINGLYMVGNQSSTFSNSTEQFITTESGHYYKCNAEQSIPVGTPNVHLVLSNFAYEAYRQANSSDFYMIPQECAIDAGQVSDFVRIGVGICLVALVVIVLIAYFVGRRRWSERSSYESV